MPSSPSQARSLEKPVSANSKKKNLSAEHQTAPVIDIRTARNDTAFSSDLPNAVITDAERMEQTLLLLWGNRLSDIDVTLKEIALCVFEIVLGVRPIEQLSRWVTSELFQKLRTRRSLTQRHRDALGTTYKTPKFHVGSAYFQCLSGDRLEATVLLHLPGRVKAVSLTVESFNERWRICEAAIL